ncbi:MAG: hypothetical protein ACRC91_01425, partial [Aeromonas sp.]
QSSACSRMLAFSPAAPVTSNRNMAHLPWQKIDDEPWMQQVQRQIAFSLNRSDLSLWLLADLADDN